MRASLVLLLGSALLLAASTPPRPATVREAGEGPAGLRVSPPVIAVTAEPGAGVTIPLRFHNGDERDVTLSLTAVGVDRDEHGRPRASGTVRGAARWVTFAARRLHLAAGTVTSIAPAVNVPPDAELPALLAIRATRDNELELVSLVALADPGATPDITSTVELERDGADTALRTSLDNTGDAAGVVTLRSALRSFTGRLLLDETTAPLLVPAGGAREVTLTLRTPTFPGPYTAEVVAVSDRGPARARASAVLWNPPLAAAALAILLLLALTVWWIRRRRRSAADERPRPLAR